MKTLPLLLLCASPLLLGGCTQGQTDQTQQTVEKTAQNALDKTKDVVGKGWQTVQKTGSQVEETTKIKSAIGSSDVDTSNVSVETIGKTVYMIGNVPTQAMKDKAEKIAKAIADTGYTIENNLKVEAAGPEETRK